MKAIAILMVIALVVAVCGVGYLYTVSYTHLTLPTT